MEKPWGIENTVKSTQETKIKTINIRILSAQRLINLTKHR